MINGHGDDGYQYIKITANFSSNVYHQFNGKGLEQYLIERIKAIHNYPEPDAASLSHILAKHHHVALDTISVTNGATEAIYLIAQAFRGSYSTIVSPVFSEYADACVIHQHQIHRVFSLTDIPEETVLCWICNPNNPTGEVYDKQQLLTLIKQRPNTYFVIDQSYAAFAIDSLLDSQQIIQYPNVMILHSMTKQFAIPGLRLGYIIASACLLEKINYFRMPWSVNSLAIMAGHYLLKGEHTKELQVDLKTLLEQTQQLQKALAQFDKLQVFSSQTHYFLVKIKDDRRAADLKDYLATQHHMLIRDASNFVGLDKSYFRIACQSAEQNNALVKAIGQWLIG